MTYQLWLMLKIHDAVQHGFDNFAEGLATLLKKELEKDGQNLSP